MAAVAGRIIDIGKTNQLGLVEDPDEIELLSRENFGVELTKYLDQEHLIEHWQCHFDRKG